MGRCSIAWLCAVAACVALAAPASATFPGRDGRVAFASNRGGQYDLFATTPRGRATTRLTRTPTVNELQPAWSPDGRRIAFGRRSFADQNHPGPWEIWVMNADGSHQRRIARGSEPAWSPDGRSIAFTGSYTPRVGHPDIWVMHSDGTHKRRLTVNTAATDTSPDWSPDGRLIAYVSNLGGFGNGTRGVWTMRTDGSHKRRLTPAGLRTASPSWSPDGKRIAFVRWPGIGPQTGNDPHALWTMSRDGSGERSLVTGFATSCSWAPAGGAVAYAGAAGLGQVGDVFTADLGGSAPANLSGTPADDVDPAWQPRP